MSERVGAARACVVALVSEYGDLPTAAQAYAVRFGVSPSAAERMFYRLRGGRQTRVEEETLDRLTTFAGHPEWVL